MYVVCPKCSFSRRKSGSKSLSVREFEGSTIVKCFHASSCEWNVPHVLSQEELLAMDVEIEPYSPPIAQKFPQELLPANDDRNTYYKYLDNEGSVVLIIHRIDGPEGKKVFPMHYDGEHSQYGMPVGLFLYGRETLALHPDSSVLVVEGEKAVRKAYSALRSKGIEMAVVTWPLGSSNVLKGDWSLIRGREVILWPDNDEAGISAMMKVKEVLEQWQT